MPVLPQIAAFEEDIIAWRRDIHEHPEIGMQEHRTSAKVADLLSGWGIETHTNVGNTGVVGVLHGNGDGKRIGLRADMDALPIDEKTNLAFASKTPGVMHACGHDAHTAMLLGAARYLAESKAFGGTAVFIFQPAEEGLGGARAMLADDLFGRFPCDEVYGMHNNPNGEPGRIGIKPGEAMAGADFFDITVNGFGSHAAHPQQAKDPIVIASALVQQLQTVVARNVPPTEPVVLSVTQIHSGAAYNVIPGDCVISGTMRYFNPDVAATVRQRIRDLCAGIGAAYGAEIVFDNREIFDVLVNDATLSAEMLKAAADVVGDEMAITESVKRTGSEDFADMLRAVPGAYCTVGHAGTVPLHNEGFTLDESCLAVGASIYARVVERRTAA